MYRHKFCNGLIIILSGSGPHPLGEWSKNGRGSCSIIADEDSQSMVIEIRAIQFCTTYISMPRNPRVALGIRLPYLTMVIKYLRLPFCFELELLDCSNMKRRFRASSVQSSTKVNPLLCHMPLSLSEGWNKIQIDLACVTKQAYNTDFLEFLGMQIYANCRIRAIYFSDRWYADEELPKKYKLGKPVEKTRSRLPREEE